MRGPKPTVAEFAGGPGVPPGSYDLAWIEVTQAVQDLENAVPLIAGKPTIARVFLDRPSAGIVRVVGEIEVTPSSGPPVQLPSLNAINLDPAENSDLTGKRLRFEGGLNFQLPASVLGAGGCSIRLLSIRLSDTGEELAGGPPVATSVDFIESPPLRVRLVSFRYQTGNPARDHEPSVRDHALIESWLGRAYPVPNVALTRITVQGMQPWPNSATMVNVQLTAMRNADLAAGGDPLAHYFGLVADSGAFMQGLASAIPGQVDPSAIASGPTGAKYFAWDTDGSYGDWYTGHELGHTFGRPHVGSGCGDIPKDNGYPYPSGQLSGSDNHFVGFDVGDPALGLPMAVYPGTQYHDVMTYCSHIWMSAHTYENIRARLAAEFQAHAGPGPAAFAGVAPPPADGGGTVKKWLNVVGTVNYTTRTGTIDVVQSLTARDMPPGNDERAHLRLFDDGGNQLGEYRARVKLETCRDEGDEETGIVDSFLSIDDRAARVDLVVGQDTVASRRARGGAGVLGFAASPAPPTYTAQLSNDDGATWQTVAVGLSQPNYPTRRGDLAARPGLRIRFLGTFGFDTRLVREDILE